MIFRTSASRLVPVLLTLLAAGGCAPVEGDEDLQLGDNEQALITEIGFPKLDGPGKESANMVRAESPAIRFVVELRSGSAPGRSFEASAMTWESGRLQLVLEGTSQREVDALSIHSPSSAVVLHLDEDGETVLESVHTGVRLIGRPRVLNGQGRFSAELAYEAFSLVTL
jgi:hypothetical protein